MEIDKANEPISPSDSTLMLKAKHSATLYPNLTPKSPSAADNIWQQVELAKKAIDEEQWKRVDQSQKPVEEMDLDAADQSTADTQILSPEKNTVFYSYYSQHKFQSKLFDGQSNLEH
jgi:hypothetical protein